MVSRIEIDPIKKSSEARAIEHKLRDFGELDIHVSHVYTIDAKYSKQELVKIAAALHNPVVQKARIDTPSDRKFAFALELGFLPGVTDNVANTASEIIADLLKSNRPDVFTSRLLFISGDVEDVECIAHALVNTLIERYHIKTYDEYKGMDSNVPRVKLDSKQEVLEIDLEIPDKELEELGKKGILDPSGQRRGPLALDLNYLKTIREYYRKEKRKPTDIELESIAQTWSEHCKHTIFASEIDDVKEGIFDRYIKGATEKIREKNDFCISVFKDNSGAIEFDDDFMVTDKAETHNSPSALDPFGGAITGIVGVNRDTIGFGMGALPIVNKYGFCFGRPEDTEIIYRGQNQTNPSLLPKRIMDGVIAGVNSGGNCSGIPTPTGFCFFDDHYKGKPLIFVGTIGLMPRTLPYGIKGHEKSAQPGDNVVVIGGRVGKDGIHGATFSSEAMDEGSPATAVQIGDPITQKKLSDALVKEARDRGLYNSNTDNGAGGLSCSVAEMAEECGGFTVELEKVPVKYPGLEPWETWISESQERMTLAVPDKNLEEFMRLMESRGVEATVIGTFNGSGRAKVTFKGKDIFDLDMNFLHHGLPKVKLTTKPYKYLSLEPEIKVNDQEKFLLKMLGSHNICSTEFISKQYDHEVQNNSVIKPLVGKGRVSSSAQCVRPVLDSEKGIVISQTVQPRLSEVSCYDMAAVSIDTAIRNNVAAGGNPDHMALLDNFCWCSSNEPERLAQLKDAAEGCYDTATVFGAPFISGKDSMFNDFKGYDKNGPIKISVHPTLMISTISVIPDISKTKTFDFKQEGDLIYMVGRTKDECGGSELYNQFNTNGASAPKVDANKALELYRKIYDIRDKLSSIQSVERGGLLIALAKMAIAGQMGAVIDSDKIPADELAPERLFYSETQSRFIIAIDPAQKEKFEEAMKDFECERIGLVTDSFLEITKGPDTIIRTNIKKLEEAYKERFGKW